jgi:hypothetical protein
MFYFIIISFSLYITFAWFYSKLQRGYQEARNNLLLVTDLVLVKNEDIMEEIFGEEREKDIQRRKELARRFKMVRNVGPSREIESHIGY